MLSLFLGLLTTHIGGENYNNDNDLIGIQYDSYIAAHMTNSHYRESYILAYDKKMDQNWGFVLGASSGYDYDCMREGGCSQEERDDNDIMPVVAPYYKIGNFTGMVQFNAIVVTFSIDIK